MVSCRRAAVVVLTVNVVTVLAGFAPADGAVTRAPAIDSLLVAPAEVGPGLTRTTYSEGRSLSPTTVGGLCGYDSRSDAQRTARVQVRFVPAGKPTTESILSQEVVTYSAGGAKEALVEIAAIHRACQTRTTLYFGPRHDHRGSDQLTVFTIPGLPGVLAFKDHFVRPHYDQVPAEDKTSVEVYQVRGNTLSAVYAFPHAGTTTAGLVALASRAARAAARHLAAHA